MNTKISLIITSTVLLAFGFVSELQAQQSTDSLSISIEEAVKMVQENNYEVLLAMEDRAIAKARMNQANAVFLPQLSLEETAIRTTDPVAAFGFKLRQGIATPADFDPAVLNNPDAITNYNSRVQVLQPLFNPDGILERAAARSGMLSARENEEATRFRQVFRIKEIYYRLSLLQARESTLQTGLAMAQSVESQASDYLEQGLINRADYLEAKVLLLNSEEQLLSVRNMIRSTEDEMLIMLGKETDQPVKLLTPLDSIQPLQADLGDEPVVNSGLQALSYRVDASEQALKASKFQFIPKINLFGSYEFNDNVLLGLENENYTLGATLKWDLFKGFSQIGKVGQRKAEYRSAQIRYEQQYEEMQKEVRSRRRSINEAEKRIELNRLASEQALEEFTIRKNRYEQGLETTSDLLKAETRYLSKELGLLQAIYDYRVNLASLEYLYETEF